MTTKRSLVSDTMVPESAKCRGACGPRGTDEASQAARPSHRAESGGPIRFELSPRRAVASARNVETGAIESQACARRPLRPVSAYSAKNKTRGCIRDGIRGGKAPEENVAAAIPASHPQPG